MGLYPEWMFALILILSDIAMSYEVRSTVGDTLTLPCTYSVISNNGYTMCWGKGHCTALWCDNVIIETDGSRVTTRTFDKYQLLGDIKQGDVSLTITNVTQEDGKIYCCRVKIPGWFNDQKNIYTVKVHGRQKLDTSTRSNDRHKETTSPQETAISQETEANRHTYSGNDEDDGITPQSDFMTPVMIAPSSRSEGQNNKIVFYIRIAIFVLITTTLTAAIAYKYKVKDKKPSISAGPMTELAASGIVREENI
ncbi:uncharacterized protein [Pyxicephalus adspersus]|uniref:uncharacterized protein isoform X2 n=1 Tax=Pyxicephalus adspersus TaxID=30357 RepID=UPI003B5A9F85